MIHDEPDLVWESPEEEYFEPEPEPEPEPVAVSEPVIEDPVEVTPEEPVAEPAGSQVRPAIDDARALAVLEGALDNLGSAHHRPFSRG